MSRDNIIRAWKDENFRNSLSLEEGSPVPVVIIKFYVS